MKYRTVGTVPDFNRKIVERGKMYTPTTHIHATYWFIVTFGNS
jgi:hypothetical protein